MKMFLFIVVLCSLIRRGFNIIGLYIGKYPRWEKVEFYEDIIGLIVGGALLVWGICLLFG
jgi:hypothetical protein